MELRTDLPNLQSVKLGNYAFRSTETFAMTNLTSLQSIEFGQWCFGGRTEVYECWGDYYQGYVGGAQFTLRGINNKMN